MRKTIIYWILITKLYVYMIFNFKKLEKAKKDNDTKKYDKISTKACNLYEDAIFNSTKSNFEVMGTEKIDLNETYLVVANHLGITDIASILKAFPKYIAFVSKKELSNIFLFSKWMRITGSIFMDRESIRASIPEVNVGIENLKNGISMCIFPEGTRSITKEIGEFKKGSFRLALKSGVKILPTVLVGTRSAYEDNGNKFCKGDIKVVFLDPIDINKLNSDEVDNLHVIIRNKIEETYKKFV